MVFVSARARVVHHVVHARRERLRLRLLGWERGWRVARDLVADVRVLPERRGGVPRLLVVVVVVLVPGGHVRVVWMPGTRGSSWLWLRRRGWRRLARLLHLVLRRHPVSDCGVDHAARGELGMLVLMVRGCPVGRHGGSRVVVVVHLLRGVLGMCVVWLVWPRCGTGLMLPACAGRWCHRGRARWMFERFSVRSCAALGLGVGGRQGADCLDIRPWKAPGGAAHLHEAELAAQVVRVPADLADPVRHRFVRGRVAALGARRVLRQRRNYVTATQLLQGADHRGLE